MPHVSKQKLNKKVAEKIYAELLKHITVKEFARDRARLCSELLTHTEQIMLAKRLAIVCMLGAGFSFETIEETLKVSPSTIGRIWQEVQKGKFPLTVRLAKTSKAKGGILNILEKLLELPYPRTGPRWQFLDTL